MNETFSEMLLVGGHANSLGRVDDVIQVVLDDSSRLDELYACLFNDDAWVRMRAADALEKICRIQNDWINPYVDKFQADLASSNQPSIQWHLAQIYQQVELTIKQRQKAIKWMTDILANKDVDWIVAANTMDALVMFARENLFDKSHLIKLLQVQQSHKSNAVIKRANKYINEFS